MSLLNPEEITKRVSIYYPNELCEGIYKDLCDNSLLRDSKENKSEFMCLINKHLGYGKEFDKNALSIRYNTELFLNAKKLEGLSPCTIDGYSIELRLFANLIRKPINTVTVHDIRLFLGDRPYLKNSSVATKLSVLKSFFGWLVEEDILEKDPTKKVKPPKQEQSLPKYLSIEELELIRESCKTLRQRAMVEVLYATGCRLSEVQQMSISKINRRDKSYKVIGKGSKEREVFFSAKCIYHLNKYLESRRDAEDCLFVSMRKPYRRVSERDIQREIKTIGENSGLSRSIHPHIFRHTFATLMLNNGADICVIQELLGHTDLSTTQVYAKVTSEHKKQQYNRYFVQ